MLDKCVFEINFSHFGNGCPAAFKRFSSLESAAYPEILRSYYFSDRLSLIILTGSKNLNLKL
jgi:hypothetical protein